MLDDLAAYYVDEGAEVAITPAVERLLGKSRARDIRTWRGDRRSEEEDEPSAPDALYGLLRDLRDLLNARLPS